MTKITIGSICIDCICIGLVNFNMGKCQVLNLGKNNFMHQYTQEDNCRKLLCIVLGVLMENKLTMSQQCTAKSATDLLGFSGIVASSLREVILPLCTVLVRLHLQGWVQFWASTTRKI